MLKGQVNENDSEIKVNGQNNDELKLNMQDQRNLLQTATNYFRHP